MLQTLTSYIRNCEIMELSAHDVINWLDGKIKIFICRLDVGLVGHVWTGNPLDKPLSFNCQFYHGCLDIVKSFLITKIGFIDSDIRDRFISHGKLWLVTRDGQVLDESTVRINDLSCLGCKKTTRDKREEVMWTRQDGKCLSCFARIWHTDTRWEYVKSTAITFLSSNGYRLDYDPILGTTRQVMFNCDVLNRSKVNGKSVC